MEEKTYYIEKDLHNGYVEYTRVYIKAINITEAVGIARRLGLNVINYSDISNTITIE